MTYYRRHTPWEYSQGIFPRTVQTRGTNNIFRRLWLVPRTQTLTIYREQIFVPSNRFFWITRRGVVPAIVPCNISLKILSSCAPTFIAQMSSNCSFLSRHSESETSKELSSEYFGFREWRLYHLWCHHLLSWVFVAGAAGKRAWDTSPTEWYKIKLYKVSPKRSRIKSFLLRIEENIGLKHNTATHFIWTPYRLLVYPGITPLQWIKLSPLPRLTFQHFRTKEKGQKTKCLLNIPILFLPLWQTTLLHSLL